MAKNESQIHVRVPDDLKVKLEASAQANGRSMNAEIVFRLEESINPSTKMDLTLAGMDDPHQKEALRDTQGNITVGLKIVDHPKKGHVIRITHINNIETD